jgi:hypothetical protein
MIVKYIQVAGSELHCWNIFDQKSFERFIPEGYVIKEIKFYQEEEFNDPYHWDESQFYIGIGMIGD